MDEPKNKVNEKSQIYKIVLWALLRQRMRVIHTKEHDSIAVASRSPSVYMQEEREWERNTWKKSKGTWWDHDKNSILISSLFIKMKTLVKIHLVTYLRWIPFFILMCLELWIMILKAKPLVHKAFLKKSSLF